MDENLDVTQIGEVWGKFAHRKAKIERCENGYIMHYSVPSQKVDHYRATADKVRVFLTNNDMLEFLEKYFEGEPRP